MSNEKRLNLSEIILLAMTRGMLGAGVGLLAASKLNHQQRIAIGRTLVLVGAVTTFPLAWRIFGQRSPALPGPTVS
ncbi:MAG TPA: hypothetical protein VL882_21440 [Vicinamibacterales bacterium]|jgi:hypothetical protein|nr:hypothetical protein [Vicinamibacterales bacterium]